MCVYVYDDVCFYYHSSRNNVVIAFGTLSSCMCMCVMNTFTVPRYINNRTAGDNVTQKDGWIEKQIDRLKYNPTKCRINTNVIHMTQPSVIP